MSVEPILTGKAETDIRCCRRAKRLTRKTSVVVCVCAESAVAVSAGMLRQILYPTATAAVSTDASGKLFDQQHYSSLEKLDSG